MNLQLGDIIGEMRKDSKQSGATVPLNKGKRIAYFHRSNTSVQVYPVF